MSELIQFLALFGIGCLAGLMNVLAGGGSAITVPALMFLGLDPATANGTNRVAIVVQNVSATASFGIPEAHEASRPVMYGLWTLPGAVLGALAAVRITDAWFERVLAVVLLGLVITMIVPRRKVQSVQSAGRSVWIYPALLGIGFYGGFIQVGVGFLFMAAFYHVLQMDLVRTSMHKVAIILMYTLPALLVFAVLGNVNWLTGFALAAGNAAGGWQAARLAIRNGEKVVRAVLVAVVLGMGARMMGVF